MEIPDITVAILAGGAGTRLGGRDKGLQALHGRPLIASVIAGVNSLRHAGARLQLLIVANRHLGEYAVHARTIRDEIDGYRGPLAGIAAALAASTTSRVLTLPVDCPEPPENLLERLTHVAVASAATILVAHDGERRQPLFALYRGDLAAAATAAAAAVRAGQGVRAWQDAMAAREVDFSDLRRQFLNLNTAEDFDRHVRRGDP